MLVKRKSLMPSLLGSLPLVVMAVIVAGGRGDDDRQHTATPEAQVRAVVQRFGAASARKDYREICDRLIAKALSDKVEQFGLPCEKAFKQGLGPVRGVRLRVGTVRVAGATAFAQVHTTATGQPPSDDTLKLLKVGQAWKIVSLAAGDDPGAKPPTAPKPAVKKSG